MTDRNTFRWNVAVAALALIAGGAYALIGAAFQRGAADAGNDAPENHLLAEGRTAPGATVARREPVAAPQSSARQSAAHALGR